MELEEPVDVSTAFGVRIPEEIEVLFRSFMRRL